MYQVWFRSISYISGITKLYVFCIQYVFIDEMLLSVCHVVGRKIRRAIQEIRPNFDWSINKRTGISVNKRCEKKLLAIELKNYVSWIAQNKSEENKPFSIDVGTYNHTSKFRLSHSINCFSITLRKLWPKCKQFFNHDHYLDVGYCLFLKSF